MLNAIIQKYIAVKSINTRQYDGCLNPGQLAYLKTFASTIFIKKDDYVFQAGAPTKHVFILLSGRLKLSRLSPQGRQIIQWFCLKNEFFGLSDILQCEHHTLNAQASSDCAILMIPASEFTKLLVTSPDISLLIIEHLSNKLSIAGDLLLGFSSDTASQKVSKLLLRLARSIGLSLDNSILLDMPLTHQELADMAGLCRQTMTTILNQYKQQGYIKIDGHHIAITDIEWLLDCAD